MTVTDELLARLRTVPGTTAAFDTDAPSDPYTVGASPTLFLQSISGRAEKTIDGQIHTDEERWQVSVRGKNLANVRAVVRAVRDSLHGYRSGAIKYVSFESAPGVISEGSGSAREYHAPVDFMVTT